MDSSDLSHGRNDYVFLAFIIVNSESKPVLTAKFLHDWHFHRPLAQTGNNKLTEA